MKEFYKIQQIARRQENVRFSPSLTEETKLRNQKGNVYIPFANGF